MDTSTSIISNVGLKVGHGMANKGTTGTYEEGNR